ncbi:MAG: Gfo/Idh/MocA family oxidoreductase [Rikenellaceae bacterium]|jgi:predicted dehydrogenase|nr:Gfo/Idh/MocA family oxidoreductase [Rikenellaceae bacterium]
MKPIKVGLASYGMSGQVFHAPFIAADPHFELTAAVERSKDLIRERYPAVQVVRSFGELIALPGIELVVVNTPDVTHYEYSKLALEAGKHVVVEKPFVTTIAQAEELTALAAEKGLLLTAYQNRRLDGDFRTARHLIETGELGRVIEYNAAFERFRDVRTETWKERTDTRVGLLYNLGSHSLDQALVLFGMPQWVWCTMDVVRDGGQVCDYFQIMLGYPRMRANLRASMRSREPGPNIAVHGTQGSYAVSGVDPQEETLKAGATPGGEGWGSVPPEKWGTLNNDAGRAPYPTIAGDYALYYKNIHDCLRHGAAPDVTTVQMVDLIRLLETCYESNETGRRVEM